MRGLTAVCCLFVLGCASFRDAIDQDFLYLKMCAEAERAWRIYRPVDLDQLPDSKDFEQGFMDGFVAVAFGANGCPPTLPSRDYWGPRFKNDVGKARITTWYNGYAAGAFAAQREGMQDRNRLPTAVELFGHGSLKSDPSSMTPVMRSSPVAPSHDALPPIPELPPPGTPPVISPPATEPLPLPFPMGAAAKPKTAAPPTPLGSWKPSPATFEPSPVVLPVSASALSPGPAGAFGLSQPGTIGR
jgi:hypothetical protein